MKRTLLAIAALVALSASQAFAANSTAVVTALAKSSGTSEELARRQIEQVVGAIKAELEAGRDVTIANFGRFYVSEQSPRKGRNPRTGQEIEIPAKRYPRFVSADNFKKSMNALPATLAQESNV